MAVIFYLLQTVAYFALITSAAVAPGSRLHAAAKTEKWSSPKNIFSLSFIPSAASSAASSAVAAITTASVKVWSAGAAVDDGGVLEFTREGDLTLVNGSGYTVWSSGTKGMGVVTAEMEDSGNFVLMNGSDAAVWSTFGNPVDTLVPTQNFSVGMKLRSGVYSFSILASGNLTLEWNDTVVYWNSVLNSTVVSNVTNPTLALQQIGILGVYEPSISGPVKMIYSSDYADDVTLRFLNLGSDGNLRIYSLQTGAVTERWAAVEDQCDVYGYCGDLGLCGYTKGNPVCSCLSPNFKLSDPNDPRKGCRRITEISDCPGTLSILEMGNARFLTYPPDLLTTSLNAGISACRDLCFSSKSCIAATSPSDGSGICHMKFPGFLSAYHSPALPGTLFIKVCGPVLHPPGPDPDPDRTPAHTHMGIALAVAATFLGLLAIELSLWLVLCRTACWSGPGTSYSRPEYASAAPVQFTHRQLSRATNGFRDRLGEGGFGSVYHGRLPDRTGVAVKRLESIEQGEKQFRMEVAAISCTHHLNLVRLVGFCSEGRHRLLVYELMKNGSLDGFIFGERRLGWRARFEVAVGVARGVTYLHEECSESIVHCDIKPENVLLDDGYLAKVSDFGLAKMVDPKGRRTVAKSLRGTRGYLAPEWLANLPVTAKSDVYSYGMVLLELVSGKRNFEISAATDMKKFWLWAFRELETGNIEGIVEKTVLEEDGIDMEQVKRVVRVSFWCLQEHPAHRPTMGKVLQMLEGVVPVRDPPDPKPQKPEKHDPPEQSEPPEQHESFV